MLTENKNILEKLANENKYDSWEKDLGEKYSEDLKEDIKSYKRYVKLLREQLEKGMSSGSIKKDLDEKIKAVKEIESNIVEKIIPIHRKENIEETPFYLKRLDHVGSYEISGIVNETEYLGDFIFVSTTSDGEVAIYKLDKDEKTIKWIHLEKLEISAISSMFKISKNQVIILGVSGEVFLCKLDFDEKELGNSKIYVEKISSKYDEYGFDMVRRISKNYFARRIGEKEIEIFEIDLSNRKIVNKRKVLMKHTIADYIALDEERILIGDKTGNLFIVSNNFERISTIYEDSDSLRKIIGMVKTDSKNISYIWVFLSDGGFLYYSLKGDRLDFIDKIEVEDKVFFASSDNETAFILSDSGKNYILEENNGKFYLNKKAVENFYADSFSIGEFEHILFDVDGNVDIITIDRINTAEKLYNSNFIKK